MHIVVTVAKSSHPDYDLFAQTTIKGRQLACRGSQAEVDGWYDHIADLAKQHGHTVELINN